MAANRDFKIFSRGPLVAMQGFAAQIWYPKINSITPMQSDWEQGLGETIEKQSNLLSLQKKKKIAGKKTGLGCQS